MEVTHGRPKPFSNPASAFVGLLETHFDVFVPFAAKSQGEGVGAEITLELSHQNLQSKRLFSTKQILNYSQNGRQVR